MQTLEPLCEPDGLVPRFDDLVGPAPPELKRHTRPGNLPGVRDRASECVCTRIAPRCAADLLAGKILQATADRTPLALAATGAAEFAEVAIPLRHVGDRVEGRRSREE